MKNLKKNLLLFAIITLTAFSCEKDEKQVPDGCEFLPCSENRRTVEVVESKSGIVNYWEDKKMFYVSSFNEGTIDETIVALICNMPEEFKQVGLKIQYSGELKYACDDPKPIIGGQKIYYLQLTKITRL